MPRRLLVVLALLVVGMLGVGVTTALKRHGDDPGTVASPQVTESSEPDPTFSSEPFDVPSPAESPSALPVETPAPVGSPTTGGSASGSGSSSGSGSGGSNQALGPPPSTPETGPIGVVFVAAAFSVVGATLVQRRYLR